MGIATLGKLFDRFHAKAGVLGVAIGLKDPGDPKSSQAVAFIVRRKEPRRGSRRRVASGALAIPKTVTLAKRRLATDVIALESSGPVHAAPHEPAPTLHAGGRVANASSTGTFGSLVRRAQDAALYALTNRHVAIGPGTRMFFTNPVPVEGTTAFDADLIDDERFVPFVDEPNSFFDADGALIRIPHKDVARFSTEIPLIGAPTHVFQPDESSVETYASSLVGTEVAAYSWSSGLRKGIVSHVLYVTRESPFDPRVVYSCLIRSTDGLVSQKRDSGKVWITTVGNRRSVVGLHQGVIELDGEPSSLAVATDFRALGRFLRFRLA